MLDLTVTCTTFVTRDTPSSQGVQFRPVIRRWVSHVSPESLDVQVMTWTRGSESVHKMVKLPEAQKMAQKHRDAGWREERWG